MDAQLAAEIERLRASSVAVLRAKYRELFEQETRSANRGFLWRKIAWRLQVRAEGDLSERARRRAAELARDADLKVRPERRFLEPPRTGKARDARLPPPGTTLRRQWAGRTVAVMVLAEDFEYEGRRYSSLSAVSGAITGTHWNGYGFFRAALEEAKGRG
jgi:hypothetical protein